MYFSTMNLSTLKHSIIVFIFFKYIVRLAGENRALPIKTETQESRCQDEMKKK
jgi:hypothetical protein